MLTVSGVMVWSRRGSHGITEEFGFRLFAGQLHPALVSYPEGRWSMVSKIPRESQAQVWCETTKNPTHTPSEGCVSIIKPDSQQINSIKWKKNPNKKQAKPPNQTKETCWLQPRLLKITSSQTFISKVVFHVKWKYLSKPYVHICVVQTATTVQHNSSKL